MVFVLNKSNKNRWQTCATTKPTFETIIL